MAHTVLLSFSSMRLNGSVVSYIESVFCEIASLFKQKERKGENEIYYGILKQMLGIILTHVLWRIM